MQYVQEQPAGPVTTTRIGDSATSVSLATQDDSRREIAFWNDSSADLYLAIDQAATATNAVLKLGAGDFVDIKGALAARAFHGIWASDAGGAVNVTVVR